MFLAPDNGDGSLAPLLFDANMRVQFRRLIQMGIIMYVVLYALMLQKGYQESALNRNSMN